MLTYYEVYISGPMTVTGREDFNYPAFNEAERLISDKTLSFAGAPKRSYVFATNPARNFDGRTDLPRADYLRMAATQAATANAILLLPGWEESPGARMEVQIGLAIGHDFYLLQQSATVPFAQGVSRILIRSALDGEPRTINAYRADLGLKPLPSADSLDPVADWEYELLGEPEKAAETIEQEASRLVRNGERQKNYGHPRGDFDQIGRRWTIDLDGKLKDGVQVVAEDVALMMVSLKLARLHSNPKHHDSKVDVIGYTICLDRLDEPMPIVVHTRRGDVYMEQQAA